MDVDWGRVGKWAVNPIWAAQDEISGRAGGPQPLEATADAAVEGKLPSGITDYAKMLLGIDQSQNELRPEYFDLGGQGFDDAGDQAAFTYLEALDKSSRAYTPQEIRDINLGAVERTAASGPAAVERFDPAVIERTSIDPAAQAVFGGVDRASYDRDLALGLRDDQLANLERLKATAEGRGPSAAADEYALALDAITNEQMALVNQATGDEKVALRNEAMLEGSRRSMQAARERAAMKSREMLGGQEALTAATAGARSQDVELATQIASLDQEAKNLDAQLRAAMAEGNRDAINAINTRKAEIDAERARAQAGLTQDARAAGAQASNQSQLDYAKRLDEANATNAAAQNKRDTDRADLTLRRDVAADDAGRQAFGATTDAQIGALNTANSATGQTTQATQGATGVRKDQYELALKDKEERDRFDAAERQSARTLAAGIADAAMPG